MKLILHITGKMDRAGAENMLMNLYRKLDREQNYRNPFYKKNENLIKKG